MSARMHGHDQKHLVTVHFANYRVQRHSCTQIELGGVDKLDCPFAGGAKCINGVPAGPI